MSANQYFVFYFAVADFELKSREGFLVERRERRQQPPIKKKRSVSAIDL